MSGMDHRELPQAKTPRVSTPKLALKRFVRNSKLTAASLQFVTGQSVATELQIHPLEQQASDVMLRAIQGFFRLQPSTDVQARFVDAVHRCQTALGSLRFWHTLNQQLRQRKPEFSGEVMTSEIQLETLHGRAEALENRLMALLETEVRAIMLGLVHSYQQVLALTRLYPDQHVYDDFQLGLDLCLGILQEMLPVKEKG